VPDLLESVTLGAATGHMPALPHAPAGVDVIAETWNATDDPVELADLADVAGLVSTTAPRELIHELLWAYSMHYGDYERALIQRAIQLDRSGGRDAQLGAQLDEAAEVHSRSLTWIPLSVARNLSGPAFLGGVSSFLRSLAGFEESPDYPFPQRYIADLVHARLPPVTTEMVFGVAIAAGGRGRPARAPGRAPGRAAQEMRQNPSKRRSRRR